MSLVDEGIIVYEGNDVIRLTKWKIKAGNPVGQIGSHLFHYRTCDHTLQEVGDDKKFKCQVAGFFVTELMKSANDIVLPGEILLKYRKCEHSTIMKDLCAECGANLHTLGELERQKIVASTSVSMVHSVPELRVSKSQAETLGKADEEHLLKERKLALLVDLDQTIIHTTNHDVPSDMKLVHHFQLYGAGTPWYHTKFRPHTMDFLEKVSKKFELHICTFGARRYAHEIAHLLDPKEKYFPKDRILSRDECFDPLSKTGNMNSLFPCGDSLVCIIDDREDVWNNAPNLIRVKPYTFFKDTGDINSPYKTKTELDVKSLLDPNINNDITKTTEQTEEVGKTLSDSLESEIGKTEECLERDKKNDEKDQENASKPVPESSTENPKTVDSEEKEYKKEKEDKTENETEEFDEDDYLLFLEEILHRIHEEFYREYDEKMKYKSDDEEIRLPDLKEVIPNVKKNVLNGVNIVFSGVIPTNMPTERHPLLLTAKTFGAQVTNDVILTGSPLTTHLVAAKWGTMKVKTAAKSRNIWIVNQNWLTCCAERWERVDERLFPLAEDEAQSDHKKSDSRTLITEFNKSDISLPKIERAKKDIPCAVYDPITGKRIRQSVQNSTHLVGESENEMGEKFEAHNMLEFSPLAGFSKSDLLSMGKEVEDACSEGDELSTGNTDSEESEIDVGEREYDVSNRKREAEDSSSDDSLSPECPKGWSKKKKTEAVVDDCDSTRDSFVEARANYDSSSSQETIGSVDEIMAAALEREFLS